MEELYSSRRAAPRRKRFVCGTSLSALLAGLALSSQPAFAQTAPVAAETPAAAQSGDLPASAPGDAAAANPPTNSAPFAQSESSDIVVTGSRAIRNGNQAPTPITVVSKAQLQSAAPGNIADALNQLPVLQNSFKPSSAGSSGTGSTGNGGNLLNLRGIGAQRTLVLLDGRRLVPSNTNGSTDVNLIPQGLVQRVDIVTGGASAAYGSDAVAGVVNFVLDDRFQGVSGEANGAIASRGDNGAVKATLSFGSKLSDRLHLVANLDYFRNEGIGLDYNGREPHVSGYGIIPATGQTPSNIIAPDVRLSTATYGGYIGGTSVLAGKMFLPGGALATFTPGAYRSTTLMSGGDGAAPRTNLVPQVQIANAFAHLRYDASDDVDLFLEASYGDVSTDYPTLTSGSQYAGNAFTIFRENAFLPAAVRDVMVANNIQSFTLGRYHRDFGPVTVDTHNRTLNLVGGARWKMGGSWTASGYYEFGRTRLIINTRNNPIIGNIYAAADAVLDPATGTVVCRTALTSGNTGCVPINLFGEGAPSAAAIDYVTGTSTANLVAKQHVLSGSVQGEPFSTWAAPVSLAFGAEYRKEEARQIVDPISAQIKAANGVRGFPAGQIGVPGGFQQSNPQAISGEFDIREVFGEVNLPLARDARWAKSFDVNAAVRYADYSTTGGVTTWKAGATFEPVEQIRLRATRSRDIRAANISELFTAAQQSNGSGVRDPNFNGQQFAVVQQFTGNPRLTPEKADTFTGGVVLQPFGRTGPSLSVDYFDIKIADVITSLTVQQVADGCAAGNTDFCSFITRNSAGVITQIVTPTFNLASLRTRGVDVEGSYTFDAARLLGNDAAGTFGIRILASYIAELSTTNTGVTIDRAGELGTAGAPHWSGVLSLSYDGPQLGVFVQERFVGAGKYDVTYTPAQLGNNHVPSVFYTDVTVRYKTDLFGGKNEAFLTVNNLFDRDPPITPNGAVTTPRAANGYRYDLVGTYFTAGLRFKF